MESYKGKWENDFENITGLDEYLAANGQMDQKEMYMKKMVMELFNEGEKACTTITKEGMPPMEFKARLGERTEFNYPGVGTIFVTMTFKDDVVYDKQEIGSRVVENKSYIQDGQLVMETTSNGKTMVSRMKRI